MGVRTAPDFVRIIRHTRGIPFSTSQDTARACTGSRRCCRRTPGCISRGIRIGASRSTRALPRRMHCGVSRAGAGTARACHLKAGSGWVVFRRTFRLPSPVGPRQPVLSEQLHRMRRANRAVAARQIVRRAVRVTSPAGAFRVLWQQRYPGHPRSSRARVLRNPHDKLPEVSCLMTPVIRPLDRVENQGTVTVRSLTAPG